MWFDDNGQVHGRTNAWAFKYTQYNYLEQIFPFDLLLVDCLTHKKHNIKCPTIKLI